MVEKERELLQIIVNVISESLFLEPDEVKLESRLVYDLGMNSLDFLDIMFSLEDILETEIQSIEIDAFLKPKRSEANTTRPTKLLQPDEIVQLSPFVPDLEKAAKEGPIKRNEVVMYFTVETIVKFVQHQLRERQNETK